MGELASHANDRKLAAKSVQDGSLRLYLCVMLHAQPLLCDAGEHGWVVAGGGLWQWWTGQAVGRESLLVPVRPQPNTPVLPPPPSHLYHRLGAVVMQLGGSRFFDCYIPTLGCDVRIHTDALLVGGATAVDAGWSPEDK